jgi:protein Mpv17
VLFGAGDVLAQQLVDRVGVENHNYARTARMALYGGGAYTYFDTDNGGWFESLNAESSV